LNQQLFLLTHYDKKNSLPMIDITRPSKNILSIKSPVMIAAGVGGYGNHYHDLIQLSKVGALVTNPVTYQGWSPSRGTRVVPLESGVLVHTGLPNNGLNGVVKEFRGVWANAPLAIIVHVVATTRNDIRNAVQLLEREDSVAGIELGLPDDIGADKAREFVEAACKSGEKAVIVRLPMHDAYEIAETCADVGAGALVVSAPPRATARDPHNGRLISGRLYTPLLQPIILRMVGVLRKRIDPQVPIIGAGGIHSLQDARDFIDAGAVAVQVDSLTWIQPNIVERISRDLSGALATRVAGALPDEWNADMGDTEFRALFGGDDEPAHDGR
jgi:dihydroorotate dehydrogenase (NAD+) catalytic subunit